MDFTTKEIAHKIAAAACDKKSKGYFAAEYGEHFSCN